MAQLTGKVFVINKVIAKNAGDSFQLEAVVDGVTTRLQGEGPVPEQCLFDRRHSGWENVKITVLETCPPQYVIGCKCGKTYTLRDSNEKYEELK